MLDFGDGAFGQFINYLFDAVGRSISLFGLLIGFIFEEVSNYCIWSFLFRL